MKLVKAKVTNFRSVEDSGEFSLDDLTCLVGKNEAGKTAILLALAGLNPHEATPITFDKERDYPRRYLTEYASRHRGGEAVVIDTRWEITDLEKNLVCEEFGPDCLTNGTARAYRRYGDKGPIFEYPFDYQAAANYLMEAEGLTQTEKKQLGSVDTPQALGKALEALSERSGRQESLLQRIKGLPGGSSKARLDQILASDFPSFMFFSHYDRMFGQIRLDNLDHRESHGPVIEVGEQVFLDFLEYAGTSAQEITEATTYETLNARCEAASIRITEQLSEYWTQNPYLEIEVRVTKAESGDTPPFNSGVIGRARVKNNLHKVTVPFDERSQGFIWFFSFLVKFAQVQKRGGDVILLLDEPGLSLHGKAQADLLRYFKEKLVPHHQVVFSTHSPFMVPADNLMSSRIVEDKIVSPKPGLWQSQGTKVRGDVLATDPDTLFPLQGALGYDVTQSLFVGKHTLLVEGPGDILYLHAWSAALNKQGRTSLFGELTICPAGGLDKVQSFVSLFSGAKLEIAALTDFARSDRKKLDNLRRSQILEDQRVMTFASILEREEADVEDVFERGLYVDLVNKAYSLPDEHKVTAKRLSEVAPEELRVVKAMELTFRLLPPDIAEFDHFTPAEFLLRNTNLLDAKSADAKKTLDHAEKVIRAINAAFGRS